MTSLSLNRSTVPGSLPVSRAAMMAVCRLAFGSFVSRVSMLTMP